MQGVKKARQNPTTRRQAQASGAKQKAKVRTKKIRPNPFIGADDVYLTKNKIAVTTISTERSARGNTTTTKTKYYARNNSNLKQLKVAQGDSIRRGRNGTKYEAL